MKLIALEIPVEDEPHPANQLLVADPLIIRESLHRVTIFKDGTIVLLYHPQGDLGQVRAYLTDHKEAIFCNMPENGNGLMYTHGRPFKPTHEFFPLARSHEVVFETPITHTGDGLKITMSGDRRALHHVILEIPPDIELTFLKEGERKPGENMIIPLLTKRQVEILTLAVEEGYYETPRGTTYEKITTRTSIVATIVNGHF